MSTALSALMVLAVVVSGTPLAFAGGGGTVDLPTIAITQDMLLPLVEGVVSNISVILPVGFALFAVTLGIRIIPGFVTRFVRM